MDVESASMTTSCVTWNFRVEHIWSFSPGSISGILHSPNARCQWKSKCNATQDHLCWGWKELCSIGFLSWEGHNLEPLFSNLYDDPSQIGTEIEQSSRSQVYFKSVLVEYCPVFNERLAGGGVMTLSSLCAKSRQARLERKRAGCPTEGSLHLGKNNLKNAVQKKN